MYVEDCAIGLTRFLSPACCQLSFPADLLRAQWFIFNPLPMFLHCTAHLLHGKDKISPHVTVMFTIITSFILKLLFLQMPLSSSTVTVPHCSRANRQLTSPARVHRPAVLTCIQEAPALPAPSCWKGISWELSAFWEVALFTWTWSLGAKERVIKNKLQSCSECVNLRLKRSPCFRVLVSFLTVQFVGPLSLLSFSSYKRQGNTTFCSSRPWFIPLLTLINGHHHLSHIHRKPTVFLHLCSPLFH